MADYSDFDQVVGEKVRNIKLVIEKAKEEKLDSFLYRFFIPQNTAKHFHGFKKEVLARLREEGVIISDFIPGTTPAIIGHTREMFVALTEKGAKQGKRKGYIFE